MRLRLSTDIALILLVALLAGLTQWLSFRLASDILETSVRNRELDKVRAISRLIENLIADEAQKVQQAARLLAAHDHLGRGLRLPEPQRSAALAALLDPVFSDSGLDVLEITGSDERIVHRAQAPTRKGDRNTAWGVTEALGGGSLVASTRNAEGVTIHALQPLRGGDGEIVGVLTAGQRLDAELFQHLGKLVGARLALLSRDGALSVAGEPGAGKLDSDAVGEAFRQKIPVFRQDAGLRHSRAYMPVFIVDEAYVILAEVDSSSAFALLEQGASRAAAYALVIFAGGILIGIVALRLVLLPLRRLRQRAERLALEHTGDAIETSRGDEISAVVHALDVLTERLLRRNTQLAEAKEAADNASAAKSQFLSNMSHEIRTPLNGVLGMTELLQRTPLNAEQRRYAQGIASSGRTLMALIGDILDLAKIEAGRIQLEQIAFNPAELAAELAAVYRELAAAKGIKLHATIDAGASLGVVGDPTRLRQILSNLLGNAVKFTEHGSITLELQRLDSGDERPRLRCVVRDTGIGIAADAIKRLFRPFVQANASTTREYGGSGLGLVISQHLVEMMGGRLSVSSSVGHGSEFSFELDFVPAATPLPEPPPPAPEPRRLSGHARVLVAEDNPVNQEVVRAMLAALGARVTLAENGARALAAAGDADFDLILMDCQMPIMDGYAATRAIRSNAAAAGRRRVPIVALTANAFAEDRSAALQAGMDDYLTKPVSLAALTETLWRWVGDAGTAALPPTTAGAPDPAPGSALRISDGSRGAAEIDRRLVDAMLERFAVEGTRSIVATFLATATEQRRRLVDSDPADYATLQAVLYDLASGSLMVGATRLGTLSSEGERLARERDPCVGELLPAVLAALDAACASMRAHPVIAAAGD